MPRMFREIRPIDDIRVQKRYKRDYSTNLQTYKSLPYISQEREAFLIVMIMIIKACLY